MDEFRYQAYLDRIGYTGSLERTLTTLRNLHLAHMLSVPFENLDIHWGRRIVLDHDLLYRKVVEEKRGGFCYELNGLFCLLLRALGFEVAMLSARVVNQKGELGPEFDHMALLVSRDGRRWLADVGFGESSRWPLDLDERAPQEFDVNLGVSYRIDEREGTFVMHKASDELWPPEYVFTLRPRALPEFEEMCVWQSTSPDAHFVKTLICSIATAEGRKSLTSDRFIVTTRGRRSEREVRAREWNRVLRDEFGIEARTPGRSI